MQGYLQAIVDAITELPSGEIVGGLLFGLALSLAASGLWMLGRKKIADPLPMLCGLILGVSALSMTFGLGYSRYKASRNTGVRGGIGASPGQYHRFPGASIGQRLLRGADSNGDGRLTAEEAARFVQDSDHGGKGWVDADELDHFERERLRPGSPHAFHPDSVLRFQAQPGF